MDKKEVNKSNAPILKRQSTDDDNEAGPSTVDAANSPNPVAPIIKQTGNIFKLDIDCFEESFDYLPLEDLLNVGKTCKRLHQVAGYCFQQNYSGGMFSIDQRFPGIEANRMSVNHFVSFVTKIRIWTGSAEYFVNEQSKFHRLKEIKITVGSSGDIKMYNLITTKTLAKLEVLKMDSGYLDNNFHKTIDQCVNLKRLEIVECKTDYNWPNRRIPTLEHFKIVPNRHFIEGIPMFLKSNPSIRKLSTTAPLLCKYQDKLMALNIKLDDLAILVPRMSQDLLNSLYDSLSELYNRGFYKKLQLYIKGIPDQAQINRLVALDGLIKLYLARTPDGGLYRYFNSRHTRNISRAFSSLTNLEEIHLKQSEIVADLDTMANNLINLKRIHFKWSKMDDIIPFIRRSVEMQKIRVDELLHGVHFNRDTGIINLLALNREREQLPDAQKITLYVLEWIYLATKWAMNGNDFGLIRVKRIPSFDWDHDFEF